ncbi:MAG TPA: acyltransferase [Ktedonobacterales bacterium]
MTVRDDANDLRTRKRPQIPQLKLTHASCARWLLPADSAGGGEIRSLDGVRAIAALSIVLFHTLLIYHVEYLPISQHAGAVWYYLSTGVQLFFVLSGFLLFRPYARAILSGATLPGWARFYQRRALRILPVYWVALTVALVAQWRIVGKPLWLNAFSHILLIHDSFPRYNRDIDGPFWTLAVEAQFYLLLPLIAWGIARVVGRSQSRARLVGALLGVIALAEGLRWLDTLLMPSVTWQALAHGGGEAARYIFVLATMGMQGKSYEIFFIGALCATIYVMAIEHEGVARHMQRRLSWLLLGGGVALSVLAAPAWRLGAWMFTPGMRWGWDIILYPLVVGLSFAACTLGIVWGHPAVRRIFEAPALRFFGHISYSIYVWHLPILQGAIPPFGLMPVWQRLIWVFVVSYLSYQLLERPFLRSRQRLHQRTIESQPQTDADTQPDLAGAR